MRLKKTGLILAAPVALMLGACSTNYSPNSYDSRSVGQVNRVERGTVESYRWVQIQRRNSGTGTLAGALLGGLIGSSIEKSGSKKGGFEYLIRTESGAMVSIVQQDTSPLPEGAPVVIMFSGSQSRVVFDHNATRYEDNDPGPRDTPQDEGPKDPDDAGL